MPVKTRPCEICGQPIELGRIEAVPETRLCGEHARMIDRYGGEFIATATWERLGKERSFKPGYGGVTVEQRRNTEGLRELKEEYESLRGEESDSAG
jgi:hypothetical protein